MRKRTETIKATVTSTLTGGSVDVVVRVVAESEIYDQN